MTSYKGTFKVSPSKSLRAPRAFLMDLGEWGLRLSFLVRSVSGGHHGLYSGIVGVGIAFQQRPQLTHQCISFWTRNSRQDLQRAVEALLSKEALERVTDVTFLGYYSWLFLVPQKTRDFRQVDILYAYLHVPMHKAVRKYVFCGQQASLPFHLSTLRIGNFTLGVHPAYTPGRVSVKTTRCEAARLLRRLVDPYRYSRTGPTACSDDHQCAPVSRLDHQLREVRLHS